MGDGDATSVVPFLKALSLEILLGFGTAGDGGFKGGLFQWWCKAAWCRLASFIGVARLVWWLSQLWQRPGVIARRRCGRGQRTAAAGVAWHPSVWRGTVIAIN